MTQVQSLLNNDTVFGRSVRTLVQSGRLCVLTVDVLQMISEQLHKLCRMQSRGSEQYVNHISGCAFALDNCNQIF